MLPLNPNPFSPVAEGAEVLGRFRHGRGFEFEDDPADRLAVGGNLEKDLGHRKSLLGDPSSCNGESLGGDGVARQITTV